MDSRSPRLSLPLIPRSQPESSVVFLFPPLPEDEVAVPFIVDDRFHSHAKALKTSLAARGLWATLGSWSADHGTEGVVPLHVVAAHGGTPELIAELTAPGGLWVPADDSVEYHDWEYWNRLPVAGEAPPVPAAVNSRAESPVRSAGARKAALRRAPGLKPKVRARDGGCCRYCGTAVRWGAGRAADSGAWNWVEPCGPASPENLVVACMACHRAKAGRSLKGAGMTLLPSPSPWPRTPSRTPSDQEEQEGTSSGTPSGRPRTPSAGKTAAQKRHTLAAQDDHLDRSKSSSSRRKSSVPVQDAPAREDPADVAATIEGLSGNTGRNDISEADALHAIGVIRERARVARRKIRGPRYFRTAALNEADPYAELLLAPAPLLAEQLGVDAPPGAHPFRPDPRPGMGEVCLDCPMRKPNQIHQPRLREAI